MNIPSYHNPLPQEGEGKSHEETTLLQISGLSKHFGGLPALLEVSFGAAVGQVTALIGPNGAGKTTLLNCLSGVLPPDQGAIWFNGKNLAGLPPHQVASLGIARTFQNLRLFPSLSVLDNVLCGLTVQAQGSMLQALLRLPGLRHQERRLRLSALEALDTFGLTDKADLPAGVLPYGDKKRVELARAFVSQPVLTLLDEPVAGLNPEETAEIAGLLRLLRQQGKTMLLVEHDMELVMGVADQVVVLDGGKMIASGFPEEVRVNPLVLEAYLGRMSLTA
jgi:branched-chain amino acid transport system ATP-binding protein